MKKVFLAFILGFSQLILTGCVSKSVEKSIFKESATIEIEGARFVVPEGCFSETTSIQIEKKTINQKQYMTGHRVCGTSFTIKPETLAFEKPILFSLTTSDPRLRLAAKIADGFVPLAESKIVGETLQAALCHGGEYYVVEMPDNYGILDAQKADSALLIATDIYVGDYVTNFIKALKVSGYQYPVWIYDYNPEVSVEDNARNLSQELKRLHDSYGKFILDAVGFGIGGLVVHRYVADPEDLYRSDISPAIIAVGTPFFGSNFALNDSIKKAKSPYKYFYQDGLGDNTKDIAPGSEFLNWIREHRTMSGWSRSPLEENKNFASIRSVSLFSGPFPEESTGDGLVSLESGMLTFIEPDPFHADHFELFDRKDIRSVICQYVDLYRNFNWPLVFTKVWRDEIDKSVISECWEKEALLNFRKRNNFEALLEWNNNMLKSAPRDAILITNGDNDTYPAWCLQERGVRTDVMVVNWSLLNTRGYIHYIKKNGLLASLPAEKIDSLRSYKDKTGEIVYVSDYIINLLLQQAERPIVFSTTLMDPQKYEKPLKLTGLVYEIGKGDADVATERCTISVDITRTAQLFSDEFVFNQTFSIAVDSLSQQIQGLTQNYAAATFQLSVALGILGRYDDALKWIEFSKRFNQPPMLLYNEALTYLKMDEKGKADSIFQEILKLEPTVEIRKSIAKTYFENGYKDKAIVVLADYLSKNPDDREITSLIKKYQEE